jgi:hypothetical protein
VAALNGMGLGSILRYLSCCVGLECSLHTLFMDSYCWAFFTLACLIAHGAQAQAAVFLPSATANRVARADFTWGGDVRARDDYYNSSATLNNEAPGAEQHYFRTRARVWASYAPAEGLALSARLAAEPRNWVRATTVRQHTGRGNEWRYVIADSLNVKWTSSSGDLTTKTTIGRQDIQFGDAWLVNEGTPADGSWTVFFDAARLTVDAKAVNTQFDLIYLNQRAHPTDHLAVVGNRRTYLLSEQDEQGVILYAVNKSVENVQIDGYFIYKNDTPVAANGTDGEIYTTGLHVSGTAGAHWAFSGEGAFQWGKKLDRSVKNPVAATQARALMAYGAQARLIYRFKDKRTNVLSLVGEFLSGDKAGSTHRDEMFDVLWGRYPRLSEVGATTFAIETGGRSSQYNNLGLVGTNWTFTPVQGMSCSATYYALFARQALPTRATNLSLFSGSGHFRGNYFQSNVRYAFTRHLSALLLGEAYFQGNYYSHRETMTFARGEIMLSF